MANQIIIHGLSRRPSLAREVEKIAQVVLRFFYLQSKELDIIFLGNEEMVSLKKSYLPRKSGPANTLSFPAGDEFPQLPNQPAPLGEVFLNSDLTQYRVEEITPLLIHSILHLLGYHHEKERDKIEMDRLASKVTEALRR